MDRPLAAEKLVEPHPVNSLVCFLEVSRFCALFAHTEFMLALDVQHEPLGTQASSAARDCACTAAHALL